MSAAGRNGTRKTLSRRRVLRRLFLGAAAITVPSGAYAGVIGPDRLVLSTVDVAVPDWPRSLDGVRVGQITDTHCDSDHALERAALAARMLLDAGPDVVLLTGDFVTVNGAKWAGPTADALAPLVAARMGAFAVLGNHDWWAGGPHWMDGALRRCGIRVLRNESASIGANGEASIVGLDCMCEDAHDLARALRRVPTRAARLLAIHEPDYADECPAGFAMQFSGHSHGGQVRIPGLGPILTPIYARTYRDGLKQGPHHVVHVSRGVGVVSPRVRLFCDPEVNVVTIRRA